MRDMKKGPAEPVPRLYVPFVDGGPGRKFPGLILSRHSMPLDGLRPDRDATRLGLALRSTAPEPLPDGTH